MSEINKEDIERILKNYEMDESIEVIDIITSPAVGKGENFMSVVYKVVVNGKRIEKNNNVGFSRNLIIKRPFRSDWVKQMLNTKIIFENEVLAYNHIIPALKKSSNLKISVPQCMKADLTQIVLEDLSADGFQMKKKIRKLTIDHCLPVLKELATLHAASVNLKSRDLKKFQALTNNVNELFTRENLVTKKVVGQNIEIAIQILQMDEDFENPELSGTLSKVIEKLEFMIDSLYLKVCDIISCKKETDVLNHGDCWMNNILFKDDNNSVEVKLIDLQIMRHSSVAADLSYFLYINLDPEERYNNLPFLLEYYIMCLHNCFKEHGLLSELNIYSKKWLLDEMTRFSWFGLMCGLWISPILFIDKNLLPDMEELTEADLDPINLQKIAIHYSTPDYKRRLKSFVLNFFR